MPPLKAGVLPPDTSWMKAPMLESDIHRNPPQKVVRSDTPQIGEPEATGGFIDLLPGLLRSASHASRRVLPSKATQGSVGSHRRAAILLEGQ